MDRQDHNESTAQRCIAFEGTRRVAAGSLPEVARALKEIVDRGDYGTLLVFDERTCRPVEIDFRGTVEDVLDRLSPLTVAPLPDAPPSNSAPTAPTPPKKRGPGRPKLGVVGREITLLPRHWDWLASQPGGASVTLRKLVDQARRANAEVDRARQAGEATYRFMSAVAGNFEGFEEASRALFAGNAMAFELHTETWPTDVRAYARELASAACPTAESAADSVKRS